MKRYAALYVLFASSALGFMLAEFEASDEVEPQEIVSEEIPPVVQSSGGGTISWGHTWKYNDSGSNLGTTWRNPSYNDSSWSSGPAQLGFGDGDEATTMASGRVTYYLRTDLHVTNAAHLDSVVMDLLYDDGAIVYVNGVSVYRTSLVPPGEIPYDQQLSTYSSDNSQDLDIVLPTSAFVTGNNVIAVELRNQRASSSDVSFDMDLTITMVNPDAPTFTIDPFTLANGRATVGYTSSILGSATDPNGDSISYSKVSGPAWLSVASNGALSGTPGFGDMGLNSFTVQASDGSGGSDTATLQIQVNDAEGNPPYNPNLSNTDQIRLVWLNDPSETMTIAWKQTSGSAASVYYGREDFGRYDSLYPNIESVDFSRTYSGSITTQFVNLSGLDPDTNYYFVLVDSTGVSERYWFRTAPDTAKPFSFIAGGDSRNNRGPRQRANRLVAKLRPLFVAFTGDMIDNDNASEWNEWLDDWELTTSSDGRMYPILPHRGNHESGGNSTLVNLFNAPSDNYYALNFGGNLLRYYVLNSESGESTQASWLQTDLDNAGGMNAFTHLMAGYHKPMRPHNSGKSEGSSEYSAWATLFYNNRFDLIFESDSHTMKRTDPIRPSTGSGSDEGFIEDTANGTVYIGEGCWGAPLRSSNDSKSWTVAAGSFNGFDLVHVHKDYVEVFTVQVDNESSVSALIEGSGFSLPQQIDLWQASGGTRLVVNRGAAVKKSYAQFQLDSFGANLPPAQSDALADYDGDGLSNIAEFAFGLDATVASQGTEHLPEFTIESGSKMLKHRRGKNTTAKFLYYLSHDLQSWDLLVEGVDYNRSVTNGVSYDEVEIELIGPRAAQDEAFLRVVVTEE